MIAIKLETSKTLVENIIEAYNKEYNDSISILEVESIILDTPFIKVNGKK